jgi:hypothetical protein
MLPILPDMLHLYQRYPASAKPNLKLLLREQFEHSQAASQLRPGMRIAVGVGSRGIANLVEIVNLVLDYLRDYGAEPFIVPAMGSHGGATPAGQLKVLAEYGVTPESTGVRFEASMDVQQIGQIFDGYPVVFSSVALQADGIIALNRVKPHTDFFGNIGSGIQKMLVIGFGKHTGAKNAHRASSRLGYETVLRETAKVVLEKAPVLFGVAILEDQHHETCDIRVIRNNEIPSEEDKLLVQAKSLLPRLPFDDIDLLIIDEIGKEISGTGMDTNVIGRGVLGYIASLQPAGEIKPHISRIFVRDLTEATKGNAIGIGLADFTTTRLVNAINRDYMYTNALTSLGLPTAKIPIYFDTDSEVLTQAIASIGKEPADLRIVWIKNTLNLERMIVSERLSEEVHSIPSLECEEERLQPRFDPSRNLVTLL